MKAISKIAAAALVATALPLSASAEDTCSVLGDVAGMIMDGRQNGVSMSEAMKRITKAAGGDENMTSLGRALVLDAYKVNQWSSDNNKKQATIDFRNEAELACYGATG